MTLFNPFTLKKYIVLIIAPCLTTVLFFVGTTFYNLGIGMATFAAGLLLSAVIGVTLLKTPFSVMLEGKGLLCFDINSTGIIRPFNININPPYMKGKYGKQQIKDIFDRAAVFQLAPPIKDKEQKAIEDQEGNLTLVLDQKKLSSARFALYHYPVLIWNDNVKSLVTKDFFSESERDAFAEHGILYLNKLVEELNNHLLNFGRYVVENLKPTTAWYKNKWVIIVLVAAFIIFLVMFAPAVIQQFKGFIQPATSAAASTSSGIITPR